MLAFRIDNGESELVEATPGPRGSGEALLGLRVAAVGRADLARWRGELPFSGVTGHEFLADVLEADIPALVGRRVLGRRWLACGQCRYCHAGTPAHCALPLEVGSSLPGCFAQEFLLPASLLVPVPAPIRDYDAIMAYGVAQGLTLPEEAGGDRPVLVSGDPTGVVVAMTLRRLGRRVYVATDDGRNFAAIQRFSLHRDP